MKRPLILLSLCLGMLMTASTLAKAATYEYPGQWKVKDERKNPYIIRLNLGGDALSDKGRGQMGAWSFSGSGIQIAWMDGTSDSIYKTAQGYEKSSSSGGPSTAAEKIG